MTDAQLDVQLRLEDDIAKAEPMCIDIHEAFDRCGREALEALWDLVSPIGYAWLMSRRTARTSLAEAPCITSAGAKAPRLVLFLPL